MRELREQMCISDSKLCIEAILEGVGAVQILEDSCRHVDQGRRNCHDVIKIEDKAMCWKWEDEEGGGVVTGKNERGSPCPSLFLPPHCPQMTLTSLPSWENTGHCTHPHPGAVTQDPDACSSLPLFSSSHAEPSARKLQASRWRLLSKFTPLLLLESYSVTG